MSQSPSSPMVPVEAATFEPVLALSRSESRAFEERHQGGAKTPNPASSRTGAPSRRKARMPVASVVCPDGAISVSTGPREGTSRAARPRPRSSCSSGCATWRSSAVSSGPSAHTVAADTSRLGSSTACRANSIRHSSMRSGLPFGRRRLLRSTTSSVPPGRSSSSPAGGMIRKHVRTGSALRGCRRLPGVQFSGEHGQFVVITIHGSVGRDQCSQPRVDRARRPRTAPSVG